MESQEPKPLSEQELERLLQEITQAESESEFMDKVSDSFQDVLEKLSADGVPLEQLLSGVKHGMGVAFGHHLGVLTLERLALTPGGEEEPVRSWDMSLRLPQERIQEVRSAWPEIRTRLEEALGFCPQELRLELSQTGRWSIGQGEMVIAERELPSEWKQPLHAFLAAHMSSFLTLNDVENRLQLLGLRDPILLRELRRYGLSLSLVHEVLQLLLAEQVSIRELRLILTRVLAGQHKSRETLALAEYAREALAPWLCHKYQAGPGRLRAIVLSETLELRNESEAYRSETGLHQNFPPRYLGTLRQQVSAALDRVGESSEPLILFTDRLSRPALGNLCARHFPKLGVLSWNEIHRGYELDVVGQVESPG